jgi:hypothetical protein
VLDTSLVPQEFYARAVVTVHQVIEIILGLEFDPSRDSVNSLRKEMKYVARQSIARARLKIAPGESMDSMLALDLSAEMARRWPERRYFLEIQHDDPDEGWVQVITPNGWPPRKARDCEQTPEAGVCG